jgi:hypothetical protein
MCLVFAVHNTAMTELARGEASTLGAGVASDVLYPNHENIAD